MKLKTFVNADILTNTFEQQYQSKNVYWQIIQLCRPKATSISNTFGQGDDFWIYTKALIAVFIHFSKRKEKLTRLPLSEYKNEVTKCVRNLRPYSNTFVNSCHVSSIHPPSHSPLLTGYAMK